MGKWNKKKEDRKKEESILHNNIASKVLTQTQLDNTAKRCGIMAVLHIT